MMTIVTYHGISHTKMKKKPTKKKTITARLLSVSSVQEDGYISKQSKNSDNLPGIKVSPFEVKVRPV